MLCKQCVCVCAQSPSKASYNARSWQRDEDTGDKEVCTLDKSNFQDTMDKSNFQDTMDKLSFQGMDKFNFQDTMDKFNF